VNYTRTPGGVELKINYSDLFGVVTFSMPTGHRSVHPARRNIRDGNLFREDSAGNWAAFRRLMSAIIGSEFASSPSRQTRFDDPLRWFADKPAK
jgi:hypothetical protein